jgi:AbrB family looped-hinge helix DNA binding protein
MLTKLSASGRINVPKALRERLGMRPGDLLEVHAEGDRLILAKVRGSDPAARVYGILDIAGDSDAAIRELRGEPDAL